MEDDHIPTPPFSGFPADDQPKDKPSGDPLAAGQTDHELRVAGGENKPAFVPDDNILSHGDYIDIRKKIPQLNRIMIGVGWEHKVFEDDPLDIDLSCFLLNKAEQTREDGDFVFYNNDTACDGAVRHNGDSRNGAGDGDDESFSIDLNGIPFDIIKITLTLTIYDAEEREHTMEKVRNLYMRLVNAEDQEEVFRFPLSAEDYADAIGIKVGELIREGPKWYFSALGEKIPGGLGAIATEYGIIVAL